jgi:hypothetical protein
MTVVTLDYRHPFSCRPEWRRWPPSREPH